MKTTIKIAAILAATFLYSSTTQAQRCDRQCLIDLSDDYIEAMVAHDPSQIPLARNVRMVENVQRIQLGEGLWETVSAGPTDFVIHVPDPVSQQVAIMAVIMTGEEAPTLVGIRLKLENGSITEAEHLFSTIDAGSMANMQTPRAALVTPVDPRFKDSRERILYATEAYYDALDNNNGSLAPFGDDCVRFENGMQTARIPVRPDTTQGMGLTGSYGCEAQLDTNSFEYITDIDNRRVWIADEVTGLGVGFSHFRHAFEKTEFDLFNVPGSTVRTMDYNAFDMPAMHIFKVWGGNIHEIEAIGVLGVPFMAPTGWE